MNRWLESGWVLRRRACACHDFGWSHNGEGRDDGFGWYVRVVKDLNVIFDDGKGRLDNVMINWFS